MVPVTFEYSQASLQDYVDCRRRFQLRYLEGYSWPAVEAEPVLEHEQNGLRGQQFHRLLERYYAGIPADLIENSIRDAVILDWWRAFRRDPPISVPETIQMPEARLSVSLAGRRLTAIFDLLAVDPGQRLLIVDWKTGRYRPSREVMAARLQTLVYPFVAVEAGTSVFGGPVDPARVSMLYWFAHYPDQSHVFHYSDFQHEAARRTLHHLLDEIEQTDPAFSWPLTPDHALCKYCVFRSLCDRGVEAGQESPDLDDEGWRNTLSLEDVEEIPY